MSLDRREMLRGAVGASAAFVAMQTEQTKGEIRHAQYVIVELMGYKKLCGRLSQGVGGLLQLDVPVEGGFVTQFINPASVYRITVVDAKTVEAIGKTIDPMPAVTLEMPMTKGRWRTVTMMSGRGDIVAANLIQFVSRRWFV